MLSVFLSLIRNERNVMGLGGFYKLLKEWTRNNLNEHRHKCYQNILLFQQIEMRIWNKVPSGRGDGGGIATVHDK